MLSRLAHTSVKCFFWKNSRLCTPTRCLLEKKCSARGKSGTRRVVDFASELSRMPRGWSTIDSGTPTHPTNKLKAGTSTINLVYLEQALVHENTVRPESAPRRRFYRHQHLDEITIIAPTKSVTCRMKLYKGKRQDITPSDGPETCRMKLYSGKRQDITPPDGPETCYG